MDGNRFSPPVRRQPIPSGGKPSASSGREAVRLRKEPARDRRINKCRIVDCTPHVPREVVAAIDLTRSVRSTTLVDSPVLGCRPRGSARQNRGTRHAPCRSRGLFLEAVSEPLGRQLHCRPFAREPLNAEGAAEPLPPFQGSMIRGRSLPGACAPGY